MIPELAAELNSVVHLVVVFRYAKCKNSWVIKSYIKVPKSGGASSVWQSWIPYQEALRKPF